MEDGQKLSKDGYFHSISFPSEWGPQVSHTWQVTIKGYFHSISFPSEWGRGIQISRQWMSYPISIQLVSPASGDIIGNHLKETQEIISIQLVSPASGDSSEGTSNPILRSNFHSISFPSEWGLHRLLRRRKEDLNFHSISFPSEWGLQDLASPVSCYRISIQLVSPASGDGRILQG